MLQCYLFTAVAAGHEAAELAPGAGPEEHQADGAAAHGAPSALHHQLASLQPRLGEAELVTRQFYWKLWSGLETLLISDEFLSKGLL